jgi:hypothetical protein
MEKEKRDQNKKREEKCPLCEVSEDTIKKLKEAGEKKKEDLIK